jgi:uncharacterized protein YyaL (SSP411 family)
LILHLEIREPFRPNPVARRGKGAFHKAKTEDKPILLAISAAWCHWFHEMDEASYSDPAVIELTNREFVPVSVDSDKRPDINERYNLGG